MAAIPYAILGYGRNRDELQRVIDAATYINVGQIRDGRAPLWWEHDARYRRERHATLPGVERIQTAEELAAMGHGDCDDHAPALAASLQVAGVPARAVVIRSPGIGYHVIVVAEDKHGRRRVIDPSARRGMLMGDSPTTKRQTRRNRMRAALARAGSLVKTAEKMNPYSAAARALTGEARRLVNMAKNDREALEDEEDDQAEEATEGMAGCGCGYVEVSPLSGRWPFPLDNPPMSFRLVTGDTTRRFERSTGKGSGLHYREATARDSLHLRVQNGRWSIEHRDAYNPNAGFGSALRHYVYDVRPNAPEPEVR